MFSSFRKKIESTMTGTGGTSPAFIESILLETSKLYGAGVAFRGILFDKRFSKTQSLPCPVISVGNITVGGTGKTPMTLFLAKQLKEDGMDPVILSRGYGGNASEKGGIVSDGKVIFMEPSQSGDEPFLMASLLNDVPVCVGKKRIETGMDAYHRYSPDFFILDDGFQHRQLKRDLNILLLDSEKPFGNGFLIPRGTLREPVSSLERADVFVLTRSKNREQALKRFIDLLASYKLNEKVMKTPVFVCDHIPVIRGIVEGGTRNIQECDLAVMNSYDVVAFSGIAKNADFRRGLSEKGFIIKSFFDYPDHYSYSDNDLDTIVSKAISTGSKLMATTEKDFVRFQHKKTRPFDLVVIGVELDFGSETQGFIEFVQRFIA
ncbi:MAG: tetraacyldisaccharide 4'-kinase [Desulfobacteraceae bacterium]|jgi:tetraacyldisaccharide 4'-kinase